MIKKFQVFISSTFSDLTQERQDTIRSVLDLGHIPSGMEIFPAADVEQFEYIKKVVDECDYYVLIIGARYGSIDAAGVSFTEKEYDYAVKKKKTVLAFIHGDPGSMAAKVDIDTEVALKLTKFRNKVAKGRLVKFWTSRDELKSQVIIALSKAFNDSPGEGWVRGDTVASEELLAQINSLRNRVDELTAENGVLRSQSEPDTAGIAGLDETFEVRVSYRVRVTGGRWVSSYMGVKLTWAEIFTAIGPELMRPSGPSRISTSLVKYLQENKKINQESVRLFDTEENVIKLHLIALRLIDSVAAQTTGGGVSEFISLTPLGRRRLVELLAVRTSSAKTA